MSTLLAGLLGGLEGGFGALSTYANLQMQKKAKAEQDAADLETWKKKEDWKERNGPPKTMTETVADPDNPGKNILKNYEWAPAEQGSDPNLEPAQWLLRSTANDPNTMKLDQRSDEAAQRADQAAAKLQQEQAIAEAKNQTRLAQIEAANARAGNRQGNVVQATDENGNATFGRIGDDNVFHPIQTESGDTLTNKHWRDRNGGNPRAPKPQPSAMAGADGQVIPILKGNGISPDAPAPGAKNVPPKLEDIPQGEGSASPVFVDPSANRPMSQFSGPKAQVKPANDSNPHGKVVRTGTDAQGRRVAKYEDGTILPI